MKVGVFYTMWHDNQKALYLSIEQTRKVYTDNEIVLCVCGLAKKDLIEYERNFISVIKEKFKIAKVSYLFADDYIGQTDGNRSVDDMILWSDKVFEINLLSFEDDTDYTIFASEDLYIYKPLPINEKIDICANIRPYDIWMNQKELEKNFNFNNIIKEGDKICWYQHGHYLNQKKFKSVYTEENRKYVNNTLKKIFPNYLGLFYDFHVAIWCTFVCTPETVKADDYVLQIPSEVSDELPIESFHRTNCYAVHGYKKLYGKSL